MKQYEYMMRTDKCVYKATGDVQYAVEGETTNYLCYQEMKDAIALIIAQYECKENQDANQNQIS